MSDLTLEEVEMKMRMTGVEEAGEEAARRTRGCGRPARKVRCCVLVCLVISHLEVEVSYSNNNNGSVTTTTAVYICTLPSGVMES